jgi:hypothetical protein
LPSILIGSNWTYEHQKWSSSDIADELQNSDCPPPRTRRSLVRFINYTIKRDTVNARKRRRFIALVKCNIENKRKQFNQ